MAKMTRREFLLFSLSVLGASAFKFSGRENNRMSIHAITSDPEGTYSMIITRLSQEMDLHTVFADAETAALLTYTRPGRGLRAVVFARKLEKEEDTNITVVKDGHILDPRKGLFRQVYSKLRKEGKGTYLISIAVEDEKLSEKAKAVVEMDGRRIKELDLAENRVLELKTPAGRMKIEVKEGKIRVIESSCRNKICVRTGFISRPHEKIVCIPNRVIISVEGTLPAVDAVTS